MASRAGGRKTLTRWWLALALGAIAPAPAAEPPPWEYAPYRIQVWVAFQPAPELPDRLFAQIAATVRQQANVVAGAAWDVRTLRCPSAVHTLALRELAALPVEAVQAADAQLLKEDDKLLLLTVRAEPDGWPLAVRELDCRTRTWRPVVTGRTSQPDDLPRAAFALLRDAFSPIVRIEQVHGVEVTARPRAGGLVVGSESPAVIRDTDVLLPFIRIDDRTGEPLKNGIQVVPWTLLTVTGHERQAVQCRIHSGIGNILAGRSAARSTKLAVVVKPRGTGTDFRVTTAGTAPVPLVGYEVQVKEPGGEKWQSLGATDWRGIVTVPRTPKTVQLVSVRSGSRVLARVPIVPGFEAEVTAAVTEDDPRLLAEGFVKGLQAKVMDLMARRELYKVRFHRHLEKKELDKAKAVLDQFRQLETRSDLLSLLDRQQQRITAPDKPTQARIDKLFADCRQVLLKFLDASTINQLAAELSAATGGKP